MANDKADHESKDKMRGKAYQNNTTKQATMVETGCYVAFYVWSAASVPQVGARSLGVEKFKILFSCLCVLLHIVHSSFFICSSVIKITLTSTSHGFQVFSDSRVVFR